MRLKTKILDPFKTTLITATLLTVFSLVSASLPGQQGRQQSEEEIHEAESRKLFKAFHCDHPDPAAVKAFAGCWKVGSVWGLPTDENLKLGFRLSRNRAQLWINSYDATQSADSQNPRYCKYDGLPTVAPDPDIHLTPGYFSYVYILRDVPLETLKQQMSASIENLPESKKLSGKKIQRNLKNLESFIEHGGKYIQTMINQGPKHVWWDGDAEEDFWALPVSCEGWDEVEQKIKEQIKED